VSDLATPDNAQAVVESKDLLRNSNGSVVLPAAEEDDDLPDVRGPELSSRRSIVKFQNKVIRLFYLDKMNKSKASALVDMTNVVFQELDVLDHQEPMHERLTRLEEAKEFLGATP
jgi:hypothetical protein